MPRSEPLQVLAVCGVGMGSSLILKMTAEDALRDLGVAARVENTDISSARSMSPDVIVGQGMHTDELAGLAPVVVAVTNFLDKEGLAAQLRERLAEHDWL
ncbi:PTS sugar transporter subunit IIB [Allonocardiopsis opalescens]|uniref:PTS system ascorbate-specific IIB component n=1 Tax=Allonocardiopsis opalescens TaxID=1144618 RepID=A0A2T0PTE0_9ACTN|nr:PTS sugar transporter subunit IIB [Allonocardiopsis opalescens]PRX92171.1 PTS system ascorbate-specific IIB component [Allonocardiopsis opalescens]